MSEHKSDFVNRPEKIALHNSFAKYGYNSHKKCILVTGMSRDYAYGLEARVVKSLNTTNSKVGLNSRPGGRGGNMIDFNSKKGKEAVLKGKETRLKKYYEEWSNYEPTIHKLKKTHTIEEISKEIGKGTTALCKFLKRKNIKIPIKKRFDFESTYYKIDSMYKLGMNQADIAKELDTSRHMIYRIVKQIRKDK